MKKSDVIAGEIIAIRSTLATKQDAEFMNIHPELWLNAPNGKDTLTLAVGQKVITTWQAQIKEGVILEVKLIELVDGYARYFAGGVWHRKGDLIALPKQSEA